jgi:xanthine dehydrogenase small subunit
MVARPAGDGSRWTPVNACLVPALALDGQEVVTSEGVGSPDDLHPVQSELAERGGSQCGYCTPGIVLSAKALLDANLRPTEADIRHAVAGNLCRCTGYRPIRDAARALGPAPATDPLAVRQGRAAPGPAPTRLDGFARPTDLAEALALLAEHPDATVIAGSTDWGVEANLRGNRASYVVAVDRLPELRVLPTDGADLDNAVEIGAALTLSEVEAALADKVPLLAQVWPLFASRLIRNGATIGGNLSYYQNVEVEFPIIEKVGIRGVMFTDAGNSWNLEQVYCSAAKGAVFSVTDPCFHGITSLTRLRTSWGFGIRWFSPLGPLRFEWGFPINPRRPYEDTVEFQFTVGNAF